MKIPGIISFDGLGSLIDRKTGIIKALTPFLDEFQLELSGDEIYALFLESERYILQKEGGNSREVLIKIMSSFREKLGLNFPDSELGLLYESVPSWPLFEDTGESMIRLNKKFHLAVITNENRTHIQELENQIGIKFDSYIFSMEKKSGKSSLEFFRNTKEEFQNIGRHMFHLVSGYSRRYIPDQGREPEEIIIQPYSKMKTSNEENEVHKTFISLSEFVDFLN